MDRVDRFIRRKQLLRDCEKRQHLADIADQALVDQFLSSDIDLESIQSCSRDLMQAYKFDLNMNVSDDEVKDLLKGLDNEFNDIRFDSLIVSCRNNVISSLVGPFGLGGLVAKGDKSGGNVTTIHNAKQDIYARTEDEYDRDIYTRSKNSKGKQFENAGKQSVGSKFTQKQLDDKSKLTDAYTGEKIKGCRTSPDHVCSLKKFHKNGGYMLSDKIKADFATDQDNLASTRREINQSMSDDDKDKWMDKKSAGRNECNAEYYGVNRKLVNKKLKKGEDAAGKHAPSLVDKTCFYAVNTVSTGIGEGGKTGLLQALGLVFCEFFHAVFDEIKDIYNNGFSKGFNDPRFLKVLKKRLLRISKRVAARWVDACTAFRDGFISGFLSNMVTVIINMFITTYKRTVRIIREGFYSLVKAIKMLCCPPEGMTFAEAAHESTKLIAAGLAVIGGVTLEGCCDGMLKGTPFAPFSDIISSVLVGGLTGLATTFIVYVIDKIDLFKVNEKKKHEYVMQKLEADFDLMFSDGIALIEEITPCYP